MWWTLKCDKICKNVKSAKKNLTLVKKKHLELSTMAFPGKYSFARLGKQISFN